MKWTSLFLLFCLLTQNLVALAPPGLFDTPFGDTQEAALAEIKVVHEALKRVPNLDQDLDKLMRTYTLIVEKMSNVQKLLEKQGVPRDGSVDEDKSFNDQLYLSYENALKQWIQSKKARLDFPFHFIQNPMTPEGFVQFTKIFVHRFYTFVQQHSDEDLAELVARYAPQNHVCAVARVQDILDIIDTFQSSSLQSYVYDSAKPVATNLSDLIHVYIRERSAALQREIGSDSPWRHIAAIYRTLTQDLNKDKIKNVVIRHFQAQGWPVLEVKGEVRQIQDKSSFAAKVGKVFSPRDFFKRKSGKDKGDLSVGDVQPQGYLTEKDVKDFFVNTYDELFIDPSEEVKGTVLEDVVSIDILERLDVWKKILLNNMEVFLGQFFKALNPSVTKDNQSSLFEWRHFKNYTAKPHLYSFLYRGYVLEQLMVMMAEDSGETVSAKKLNEWSQALSIRSFLRRIESAVVDMFDPQLADRDVQAERTMADIQRTLENEQQLLADQGYLVKDMLTMARGAALGPIALLDKEATKRKEKRLNEKLVELEQALARQKIDEKFRLPKMYLAMMKERSQLAQRLLVPSQFVSEWKRVVEQSAQNDSIYWASGLRYMNSLRSYLENKGFNQVYFNFSENPSYVGDQFFSSLIDPTFEDLYTLLEAVGSDQFIKILKSFTSTWGCDIVQTRHFKEQLGQKIKEHSGESRISSDETLENNMFRLIRAQLRKDMNAFMNDLIQGKDIVSGKADLLSIENFRRYLNLKIEVLGVDALKQRLLDSQDFRKLMQGRSYSVDGGELDLASFNKFFEEDDFKEAMLADGGGFLRAEEMSFFEYENEDQPTLRDQQLRAQSEVVKKACAGFGEIERGLNKIGVDNPRFLLSAINRLEVIPGWQALVFGGSDYHLLKYMLAAFLVKNVWLAKESVESVTAQLVSLHQEFSNFILLWILQKAEAQLLDDELVDDVVVNNAAGEAVRRLKDLCALWKEDQLDFFQVYQWLPDEHPWKSLLGEELTQRRTLSFSSGGDDNATASLTIAYISDDSQIQTLEVGSLVDLSQLLMNHWSSLSEEIQDYLLDEGVVVSGVKRTVIQQQDEWTVSAQSADFVQKAPVDKPIRISVQLGEAVWPVLINDQTLLDSPEKLKNIVSEIVKNAMQVSYSSQMVLKIYQQRRLDSNVWITREVQDKPATWQDNDRLVVKVFMPGGRIENKILAKSA